MNMIPLAINLKNKKVVIFGGGKVGERKAKLFLRFTDKITVVSNEFTSNLIKLVPKIKLIKTDLNEESIEELIKDSDIVVAATNNFKLNAKISDICKKNKIFVNRVDSVEDTDIIIPSIIKQKDLTIAIYTSGKSPALSKHLRKKIQLLLGCEYPLMIKLQSELKKKLKNRVASQVKRKKLLSKIIKNENIWLLLRNKDYEAAKKLAEKIIKD